MKRRTWVVAALVAVIATGGVVALSSAEPDTPAARHAPANTATVQRGELSAAVSLDGTLTYRARSDGSPYVAINQARGIYTRLPEAGAAVECGDALYRVDDDPVLLLCGTVPAYRALNRGDSGKDVRQLNRNLRKLGYDPGAGNDFTAKTEQALKRLQRDKGAAATGALALGAAAFLPRFGRISKVTGKLGGPARPGAPVVQATSDTLEVQVNLAASQQGEVTRGDRARITLPSNASAPGSVTRIGTVAENDDTGAATIPAFIRLDDPKQAGGLDRAPVQVEITTTGVEDALSVPVTALVGKSGGGYAVEVVRDGGRRELVAVRLGLFDTANGRVEVEGRLAQGDRVVVPSL